MPYYRFCQTLEAINERKAEEIEKERKYYAMVQEISVRFLASIIASTSPLTKDGARELSDKIHSFSILPKKKSTSKPQKGLPAGGYEMAMNFFSGFERK